MPDAAEKLRDILRAASELPTPKLKKQEAARRIAPHLNPAANTSASFQHFCGAVRACCVAADLDSAAPA